MVLEFVLKNWMLFAAFTGVSTLLLWNIFGNRIRGIRALEMSEVVGMINSDSAVIIDVRADSDFNKGHILKSINVPSAEVEQRLGSLSKNSDRPHVIVCESGHASIKPCSVLKNNGFDQVYYLAGGINAWKEQNYPVHK